MFTHFYDTEAWTPRLVNARTPSVFLNMSVWHKRNQVKLVKAYHCIKTAGSKYLYVLKNKHTHTGALVNVCTHIHINNIQNFLWSLIRKSFNSVFNRCRHTFIFLLLRDIIKKWPRTDFGSSFCILTSFMTLLASYLTRGICE